MKKLVITRECVLIAIAAYLIGLIVGDFIEGVIGLLFILLVLWTTKDSIEKLLIKSDEGLGDESDPVSQNASSSEDISLLLKLLGDNEKRLLRLCSTMEK